MRAGESDWIITLESLKSLLRVSPYFLWVTFILVIWFYYLRRWNWTSRPQGHYRRCRHVILLWCHRRCRLWRHHVGWYPSFLKNGNVLSCHSTISHIFVVLRLLLGHLRGLRWLWRLLQKEKPIRVRSKRVWDCIYIFRQLYVVDMFSRNNLSNDLQSDGQRTL